MSELQNILEKYISVENKQAKNILLIAFGVLALSLLAQVQIPLPFTPVPVTGQTLGISLIGLFFGLKRGLAVVLTYLLLGALGAPIFVGMNSGLFGATSGYLLGMIFSVSLIGYFAEKGFCSSYLRTLFVCYLGSFFTFVFGLMVLSYFIGNENVFALGFLPFLPGDLIKNLIASGIYRASKNL